MAEFVTIKHPSLEGSETALVTRKAFDEIHRHKGWEVVGDAPATATPNVPSLSIRQQLEQENAAKAQQASAAAAADAAGENADNGEDKAATGRRSSARKES